MNPLDLLGSGHDDVHGQQLPILPHVMIGRWLSISSCNILENKSRSSTTCFGKDAYRQIIKEKNTMPEKVAKRC